MDTTCTSPSHRPDSALISSFRDRNKDLWGPDAHVFRPERWFEMNKEVESSFGVYGNLYGYAWSSDGAIEY